MRGLKSIIVNYLSANVLGRSERVTGYILGTSSIKFLLFETKGKKLGYIDQI